MKTVYVLNRRIDPESDLGDIKVVLQFTPLYCVLIDSVYDMQLAHQFVEASDIIQVVGDIMQVARDFAEDSDMAVLVIGEATRLNVVKEDGVQEEITC